MLLILINYIKKHIKNPIKRRPFTLIEALISIFLLSLIVTEGLNLLSRQIKSDAKQQKMLTKFLQKSRSRQELISIFYHIMPQVSDCLTVKDEVCFIFDAGKTLDPQFSGILAGKLKLEGGVLILEEKSANDEVLNRVLAQGAQEFKMSFYSNKKGWSDVWDSKIEGLPEMIHVILKTSSYTIDQKFLLPFNLLPSTLSCKSSRLSSL